MFPPQPSLDALLKPSEAARLLGVGPTTLARWARSGQITAVTTPGGQRRYRTGEIHALLNATPAAVRHGEHHDRSPSAAPVR